MQNFIRSDDPHTISELRRLGFQEIQTDGKFVIFLNDTSKPQMFDKLKINYTNNLTF